MPVTSGSAGGLPGLNLKAWAYIKADGTLLKGFNIASTSRGGVGNYTVNFTAAMAGTDYLVRLTSAEGGGRAIGRATARATGSATLGVQDINAFGATDYGGLWEFYE